MSTTKFINDTDLLKLTQLSNDIASDYQSKRTLVLEQQTTIAESEQKILKLREKKTELKQKVAEEKEKTKEETEEKERAEAEVERLKLALGREEKKVEEEKEKVAELVKEVEKAVLEKEQAVREKAAAEAEIVKLGNDVTGLKADLQNAADKLAAEATARAKVDAAVLKLQQEIVDLTAAAPVVATAPSAVAATDPVVPKADFDRVVEEVKATIRLNGDLQSDIKTYAAKVRELEDKLDTANTAVDDARHVVTEMQTAGKEVAGIINELTTRAKEAPQIVANEWKKWDTQAKTIVGVYNAFDGVFTAIHSLTVEFGSIAVVDEVEENEFDLDATAFDTTMAFTSPTTLISPPKSAASPAPLSRPKTPTGAVKKMDLDTFKKTFNVKQMGAILGGKSAEELLDLFNEDGRKSLEAMLGKKKAKIDEFRIKK